MQETAFSERSLKEVMEDARSFISNVLELHAGRFSTENQSKLMAATGEGATVADMIAALVMIDLVFKAGAIHALEEKQESWAKRAREINAVNNFPRIVASACELIFELQNKEH